KVKDGTIVEMCTHVPDNASVGMMRLLGDVHDGKWTIRETFPAIKGATLREALRLAAEAEGGLRVAGLDDNFTRESLSLYNAEWGRIFKENPAKLESSAISIAEKDRSLLHLFLTTYFRLKYADVWSMNPVDPEVRDKAKRLELQDALAGDVILEG